jgi:hypothetical protein
VTGACTHAALHELATTVWHKKEGIKADINCRLTSEQTAEVQIPLLMRTCRAVSWRSRRRRQQVGLTVLVVAVGAFGWWLHSKLQLERSALHWLEHQQSGGSSSSHFSVDSIHGSRAGNNFQVVRHLLGVTMCCHGTTELPRGAGLAGLNDKVHRTLFSFADATRWTALQVRVCAHGCNSVMPGDTVVNAARCAQR